MTFEDILRVFNGRRSVPEKIRPGVMRTALLPLATVADKFDANLLTGMAQKVGCCGPNMMPPEEMVLVADHLGRPLLTVADCLAARAAIGGACDFKDYPIDGSQS